MAGYTRQSIADIINGSEVTAPPINAEFNQLASAFNASTGHSHDGSSGNAPKINLATSLSGYLPAVHGGTGGKNNFSATTNPAVTDDSGDGYAPGSMWENTTTGRTFICVGNTANAAVWRELVQVETDNVIKPISHDQIDLGTPSVRFQDLYLSGGISASGNTSLGGTLNVTGNTTLTGAATANGGLTVNGTTSLAGDVTIGDPLSSLDTIAVAAGFTSNLVPNANAGVSLGSSTKQWNNLYIDGTATIDTLQVDENATVTGNTTLTGTLDVTGDATFVNLDATGTTTITSGDINSGAMDGTTIGASTPAAGTFTNLTANTSLTAATADINGGTVDNATIGATTPSTGAFTTISTSGQATLASADINGGSIDGATIGATSHTSGKFSTLQSTGNATLATADINGGTIDGTAIGSTTASSGAFTTVSATGGITGDLTGDVTGNVTGNVTGAITGNVTGDLTGNVTSAGTSTFNNVTIDGTLNMNAGTTATITNLTTPTNANDAATKGYVDTSVADLVDAAPGTLDTLNELAAALNDDPNFSTTITNSIATKLPLAGGTMSGAIAMGDNKVTGVTDPTAAQDAATKAYVDQQDGLQVTKTGDSMSGALAMGSNNITGLATPTANDHATNKSYVDGILGSATAASASAAAAATSESNAATSETNAANSASSAAADLSSVQSLYDQFDDRYLGSKASAPTVDNDGNALLSGALYFNNTTNLMYVYGGSGWVPAGSSVNGTSDRVTYTASAGQTVFAATYDAGYVDVYLNGVKLVDGSDFTATNGTSVVLTTGAAVNDIIDVVAYGTFTLADHYTKTQTDARYVEVSGDTMTGNLTVDGTVTADGLTVENSTAGTTVSPQYANIEFTGYAGADRSAVRSVDTSGSSNGGQFEILTANASNSNTRRVNINRDGDISFYEDTGTTAKMVWKSDNERLGLGTDNPSTLLHVKAPTSYLDGAQMVRFDTEGGGVFRFHVSDYSASGPSWSLETGSAEPLKFKTGGNIGFRPTGTTSDTVSLSSTQAVFNTDVRIEGAAPSLTLSNTTEDVVSLKLVDSADDNQNLTLSYDCQIEDGYLSVDGTTHIYFREDGNTYFGAGGGATSVPFYDAGNGTQVFPQVAINSTAAGVKNDGVLALFSWGTGGNVEPELVLGHSTSGTIGNNSTALVEGNNLGRILWNGSDGTKMANGVFLFAEAAGTWTSSTAPSNLILGIEKDDGSYSSNMFSHDGYLGISDTNRWTTGGSNPEGLLHLYGATPKIIIDNTEETEGGIVFRDGNAGDPDTQSAAIKFDSGGAVANNALSFYNNDESALRMRIYNSGEVSHPNQSCINVYRTTTVSPAVNGVIIFNSERTDNNSDYSASTGRYTAPVDGVYQLNAQVCFDGGNGQDDSMYIYITKNGSIVSQATVNPKYMTVAGVEMTIALAGTVSASAGDYFRVELADIGTTGAPNMVGNATYFSGHLI